MKCYPWDELTVWQIICGTNSQRRALYARQLSHQGSNYSREGWYYLVVTLQS